MHPETKHALGVACENQKGQDDSQVICIQKTFLFVKNMKEKLLVNDYEKQLLNQRNLIETVFDCLKHKYHVWHTRHRSIINAMKNLIENYKMKP